MNKTLITLSAASLFAACLPAQDCLLFTGRFPFVNTDAASNGGSVVQMSEYDFSYSIPVPGAGIAQTLMPATAMQCYLGDGDNDGDYLKLRSWKSSYFSNIGIDGLFVKDADQASVTWDSIFWTPRLDATLPPMEVLTNNGTPVVLNEGDWVRFLPNGNVEFFMTAAQLVIAVGAQGGAGSIGAGGIVQTANGDLFYVPIDGGHWVNGNSSGPEFAQDGAILKIDAANITYDGSGNVASFAPDSARILINEAAGGPGGTLTVRQMVLNSGAQDRFGAPIAVNGVYGKTGGLGLDPSGGTWTPIFPDSTGAFPAEPNLVFCSNAGSYGGSIWSTNNQGEIAVVNGALCGSVTPGQPADGAWLGVQLDTANFQPTLLGMTVISLPQQPLVCDMSDDGSLADNATQPNWEIDFYGAANLPVFGLIAVGPQPPAAVVPSLDIGLIPLGFTADSWNDLFLTTTPASFGLGLTNSFGYATLSAPNPNTGAFTGLTIMAQGLGLPPSGEFQLSSPVVIQLQ